MLLCWAGVIKKLNKNEQVHSIKKLLSWYEINRQMITPMSMAFGVEMILMVTAMRNIMETKLPP